MTSEVGITDPSMPEKTSSLPLYLPFRNSIHLSEQEANALMYRMLSGELSADEIAAILQFLRRKGETLAEVVGFASAIRELSEPVDLAQSGEPIIDTCGTGGDGANTFNVSTATAFVVAGAGVRVAKHGNRKISSQCGSADVLEQLGVSVHLPRTDLLECVRNVGIGFLFAPAIHPAMRHVVAARQLLQGRTVFNLLGPLTNPVRAAVQLMGAYSVRAAELLAQAAARLGTERAFVVHGADGLDEITTTTHTTVFQIGEKSVQKGRWSPSDFGVPVAAPDDLRGGDPETNAAIILSILAGNPGPQRDIVIANAAAALLIAGKSTDLKGATDAALESLATGAARRKLEILIAFTRDHDESL